MPDSFISLEWDEDVPIRSSTWQTVSGAESLTAVNVTLRDANLYTVLGLSNVAATGFITPSSAPFAWWNMGPSRLGLSNRTETYSLEFRAQDALGFMFASIIGVKVKQAGG